MKKLELHCSRWLTALLLCLAGTAAAGVRGPLVVSDRWPECTDLLSWADDIFRLENVSQAPERDRAVVFHNWLRLFNRLCEGTGGMAHAFEGAWGREGFVHDAHKHLFVYGWGYCSTHALIAEALWQEYLGDSLAADRVIVMHEDGGYHTMHRLRMDGHYGAFDARYGYYLLERDSPDARILDWEGVGDDRNILANLEYRNRCRPFFEFPRKELERALWIKPRKVFESEAAWRAAGSEPEVVFRDRKYKMGTRFHDMRFSLPRGMTVERWWDNRMKKWYVPEKNEDMFLPEGRFYRVGASMVGADGQANDPNRPKMKPYLTRVPAGLGYPAYLEGELSLGQAWGLVRYRPELARGDLSQVLAGGQGLEASVSPPYVRPDRDGGEGEWILEFYCPYIMVDGLVSGELAGSESDRVEVAFRSQVPKRFGLDEEDEWLDWKVLADKPGEFLRTLDRADPAQGGSSLHGTYRFQVRLRFAAAGPAAAVGLKSLGLAAFFENGIMSLPQLFAGDNTVRLKVDDPAQVESDILVTYTWQDEQGAERCHRMRVTPEMFYRDNQAVYNIEAPGLVRCNSVAVSYP
ncbi:MAG: hypothetical protein JXQ83_10365 [Candidatus Glassbacteria bacterium]|nr:hypothetical protein [Candidatus Glassbacteria bacterium]